jgi:hypothetical protein
MNRRQRVEAEINNKGRALGAKYGEYMNTHPFMANGVQGAVLAGMAVLVSQIITKSPMFDYRESLIMMIITFLYSTPILLWWNSRLTRTHLKMLPQLIVDQALFSPVFTAGIVAVREALLGTSLSRIPGIVWHIVPKAMISSWMFWVPAKAAIMMFVPPMYQLLAGNALSFVWTILFAMILKDK